MTGVTISPTQTNALLGKSIQTFQTKMNRAFYHQLCVSFFPKQKLDPPQKNASQIHSGAKNNCTNAKLPESSPVPSQSPTTCVHGQSPSRRKMMIV